MRFLQQQWADPTSAATPAGSLLAELVEAMGHEPAKATVPPGAKPGTVGPAGESIDNQNLSQKQADAPIEGSSLADELSL